jgi:subtilisin family serine protease
LFLKTFSSFILSVARNFYFVLLFSTQNAKVTLTADQKNAVWGIDRIIPPLDDVYSYKYDGSGVQAYILDTGIKTTHSEFNGRASCGYSAYRDDCRDVQGHGTHVAGTIGGETYGVAKKVSLISVKVLSDAGVGSNAAVYAGLDYVVGQKKANPSIPMVINLSLGGPKSNFVNEKIASTVAAGITTVIAAGNENRNACNYSPASASAAITVGATTESDQLASFSNVGPCVDILAPGAGITSAWVGPSLLNIATISGTSMSSPHAAGIAVLHLSKNPSFTPAQVFAAMKADGLRNVIRMRRTIIDILFPGQRRTPNLLLTGKSLLN